MISLILLSFVEMNPGMRLAKVRGDDSGKEAL